MLWNVFSTLWICSIQKHTFYLKFCREKKDSMHYVLCVCVRVVFFYLLFSSIHDKQQNRNVLTHGKNIMNIKITLTHRRIHRRIHKRVRGKTRTYVTPARTQTLLSSYCSLTWHKHTLTCTCTYSHADTYENCCKLRQAYN